MSFLLDIFLRVKAIAVAPFSDPLMFWEIGPLLFTLIIIELYFGRYKEEKLGWNSSVTNALVLVFVGSNLLHFLFLTGVMDFSSMRTWSAAALIVLGFVLMFLDFFHVLPKMIAFGISSSLIINVLALVVVVLVHTGLPIDVISVLAMIAIMMVVALFFAVIHLFQDGVKT